MTNTEYEAASIAAAGCYDKFEGEHKLKQIDDHIAQVEKTLETLQEMRREVVNQYSLNKCEHLFSRLEIPGGWCCSKCGVRK